MAQRLNIKPMKVMEVFFFNFVVGKASPVMIQNSEDLKKRTYINNHIKTKIHVEKTPISNGQLHTGNTPR